MQQLFARRNTEDTAPAVEPTNLAIFGMVAGSIVLLWAINRGFRGFTVSA